MRRPHSNDSQANNFFAGEYTEAAVIRKFRITAAEDGLIPEQVTRKFGIAEFPIKPTKVEKHFVETELKKIEATRKKGGKA